MEHFRYKTWDQFNAEGCLYIESLDISQNNGFTILDGSKENFLMFFTKLLEGKDETRGYIDFYFSRIKEDREEALYSQCSGPVRGILHQLFLEVRTKYPNQEFVFVEMTRETLFCLLTISYEELLFSSFYFIHPTLTVWSNYNGRFLLFTKEEETKREAIILAEKCQLAVEK